MLKKCWLQQKRYWCWKRQGHTFLKFLWCSIRLSNIINMGYLKLILQEQIGQMCALQDQRLSLQPWYKLKYRYFCDHLCCGQGALIYIYICRGFYPKLLKIGLHLFYLIALELLTLSTLYVTFTNQTKKRFYVILSWTFFCSSSSTLRNALSSKRACTYRCIRVLEYLSYKDDMC